MADVQVQIGADTTQLEAGLRRGQSALAGFKDSVKGLSGASRLGMGALGGFGALGFARQIGQELAAVEELVRATQSKRLAASIGAGGGERATQLLGMAEAARPPGIMAGVSAFLQASPLVALDGQLRRFGLNLGLVSEDLEAARIEGFRPLHRALFESTDAVEGLGIAAKQEADARRKILDNALSFAGQLNRPGSGFGTREILALLEEVRKQRSAAEAQVTLLRGIANAREGRSLLASPDAGARSASLAP